MRDPYQNRTKLKVKSKLLAFDAMLDTAVYHILGAIARLLDTANSFMRKFSVTGWKYWLIQMLSGGLTLTAYGAIFALMLAQSSFRADQKMACHIRRIMRLLSLIALAMKLANAAFCRMIPSSFRICRTISSRRFWRPRTDASLNIFGIDFFGLARAMVENARAGGVVQGGSTLTQQLAKNVFPVKRADPQAQDR